MGIIINGFILLQQICLEWIGLCDYFDLLIIFEQVGVVKLDVCIFDYVLVQVGNLLCLWVLMVGDIVELDICGGVNVGLVICWFNVYQCELLVDFELDWMVILLSELEQFLCKY